MNNQYLDEELDAESRLCRKHNPKAYEWHEQSHPDDLCIEDDLEYHFLIKEHRT